MTEDNIKMETIGVLDNPKFLIQMIRRVSSAERNRQLRDITVQADDCSLTYRVYIKMLLGPEDRQEQYIDSIQVSVYTETMSSSHVVQRCLALMEEMVKGAKE